MTFAGQCLENPFNGDPMWPVSGIDDDISLGVKRFSLCQQPREFFAHISPMKKRARVTAFYPGQQQFEWSAKPDRNCIFTDSVPGRYVENRPPASGQHMRFQRKQAQDDASLAVPELAFAEARKNFIDRAAGRGFDFDVCIEKRCAKAAGQPAPDRTFPGPHHTDECNRAFQPRHDLGIYGRGIARQQQALLSDRPARKNALQT